MSDQYIALTDIGARIKEERLRLNLSVVDFAKVAGVTDRSQRNYEGGERLPDLEYLARIKDIDVDIDYILLGERSVYKNLADEIERDCDRVERVVAVFEDALIGKGLSLPPHQKAKCVRWLYRACVHGSPINHAVVDEFLSALTNFDA